MKPVSRESRKKRHEWLQLRVQEKVAVIALPKRERFKIGHDIALGINEYLECPRVVVGEAAAEPIPEYGCRELLECSVDEANALLVIEITNLANS
jgi:hypothetical protein